MPRFFFDVEDEGITSDRNGIDLADQRAAEDHAIGMSEAILRDEAKEGHSWRVVIKDGEGGLVGTVKSVKI